VPLFDGYHAPDVQVEGRQLEHPPSLSGNRFLKGWFRWLRRKQIWYVPQPEGARFEAVSLSDRPRQLILFNKVYKSQEGDQVGITVAGRQLPSVPLTEYLKLSLPGDLPLGRFPIDLYFPEEAQMALDNAGFQEALPPGEALFRDQEIRQTGWSLVDVTRYVEAGTSLSGEFDPPANANPGQSFALIIEREGAPQETVFEWQPGKLDNFGGRRSISAELGAKGLVRFRMLAKGQGPAGTWHDLGLERPVPVPSPPDPPQLSAPKLVVLYVLDALRADYVGHLSDNEGITPNLDRIAAEGVTFQRHLSVAPNTEPSTKALFTGQAFVLAGHGKLPADGIETLAEVFSGAGYHTASFSGNTHISSVYGTDRGFQHLDESVFFHGYDSVQGAYNDNARIVHESALEWLDVLPEGESAFMYLHTVHPHTPYDPPEPFRSRFAGEIDSEIDGSSRTLGDIQHVRKEVGKEDEEKIRGLYEGGLAYNDAQIGLLMEEIKRRYEPGEVLVIFTSDHGEELFDHGGVLHGYTLYREQLEIPLILWWPGQLEPRTVTAATDNLDVHDSLRSLVGAAPSTPNLGRSFWGLLSEEGSRSPGKQVRFAAASSVKGGIFLAQSERFKLIQAPRADMQWGMGEGRGRSRDTEYVFDLLNDPDEMHNLAGDLTLEIAWLRSTLGAWVERGLALESGNEEAVLDDDTRDRLRALGYLD
jgi:arylsulfatase A-like enzyme